MKKVICVLGCLCVLSGILALGVSIYKNKETEDDSSSKYREEGWGLGEYDAYLVRDKYPTDILWIGPWEEYEWELSVRFAETVDRETLAMRAGFQYMYIVANIQGRRESSLCFEQRIFQRPIGFLGKTGLTP